MNVKLIRSEEEYEQALVRLEVLMDAQPGSSEEEELDLLAYLVDNFEKEHFPIELPDPVEAIKFRMDQLGLSRKDLIPYIGSQSKVSEVLNYKRSLSLSMIRALHESLNIPAEVLLQEPGRHLETRRYNPADFPLKEMYNDGYFPDIKSLRQVKDQSEELLLKLLDPLEAMNEQIVYCKVSCSRLSATSEYEICDYIQDEQGVVEKNGKGTDRIINKYALQAWQARVLQKCGQQKIPTFRKKNFTEDFIKHLVGLSIFPNGPLLAQQVLLDSGVHFVILQHLPKTYLDGACFKSAKNIPVIALTLRYDRLDNFWFTLMHELAHVLLHLNNDNVAFFDDIEHGLNHTCNKQESEANQLSMRVLIPDKVWDKNKEKILTNLNEEFVQELANELGISPAIIAGRARWEAANFSVFNDLLGAGSLRKMFSNFPGKIITN